MSVEFVREVAMALPNVTEQIQWEDHLLFKIGGKMFAITTLGPVGVRLSVKSTPEKFAELTEIPGVIPAPYMARNFWVALERWDAVRRSEMQELIRDSYELVLAKLPKKKQAELAGNKPANKLRNSLTPKKKVAPKKKAARKTPSPKKRR
jgi:predicted DNA-binding protein (MmcQ/YjbR family)